MDPISKALEQARQNQSVRNWVLPASTPHSDIQGVPVTFDPVRLRQRHILCGPGMEDPLIADRYRLLRTQLLQRMRADGWTKLGLTSPGPKAGKTLTAINLALSIARDENYRVVLIDADLRKPSLATELGLPTDSGLIDYLSGELSLEEVAVTPSDIPNLTIVPGRRVEPQDAKPELLNSSKMIGLLGRTTRLSEPTITLVDLPPVFVGDDVILLAAHLDTLVLIVEEGGTEVDDLREAANLLTEFNLIGTVLNKSTERRRDTDGYYGSTNQHKSGPKGK